MQYIKLCSVSLTTDLNPPNTSECLFPDSGFDDVTGSWVYFEAPNRTELVSIEQGDVVFSSLGKFVCKAIHWDRDRYKMVSYYDNGW